MLKKPEMLGIPILEISENPGIPEKKLKAAEATASPG